MSCASARNLTLATAATRGPTRSNTALFTAVIERQSAIPLAVMWMHSRGDRRPASRSSTEPPPSPGGWSPLIPVRSAMDFGIYFRGPAWMLRLEMPLSLIYAVGYLIFIIGWRTSAHLLHVRETYIGGYGHHYVGAGLVTASRRTPEQDPS